MHLAKREGAQIAQSRPVSVSDGGGGVVGECEEDEESHVVAIVTVDGGVVGEF